MQGDSLSKMFYQNAVKMGVLLPAGIITFCFFNRQCVLPDLKSVSQTLGTPTTKEMGLYSRYNKSMAIDPVYQAAEALAIQSMDCAGTEPFFMHNGATAKWVCNDRGEKKVTAVMLKVFSDHCKNPMVAPGLMLDVGSNLGYYGLMAMAMGCESILFDLQPECQSMINSAIVVNQFTSLGRVIPFGVSNTGASFQVPGGQCEGGFPASAHREGTFDQGDYEAHVYPMSAFIDRDQPILLMKVDTEGNEQRVLEGAIEYFSGHLVRNAIVEVTPGHEFWANVGVTRKEVAETFSRIASFGYTLVSLYDYSIHTSADDVYNYLLNATFSQSDVWLTSDFVNASVIAEIRFP